MEGYVSESLVQSTIDWLHDCNEAGACADCQRHKDELCLNAKSPTVRAEEVIRYLQKALSEAKGETVKGNVKTEKKRSQNANESVTESTVSVSKESAKIEPKKRGRKPKNG